MEDKKLVHEKARGESIYVYVGEYKGTKYLHIREWYTDTKEQIEKPTKKGVAIPMEKVAALKELLDQLVPKAE